MGSLTAVALAQLLFTSSTSATQPGSAASASALPFYRDPLFDGAHDPEIVWNEQENCYWLLYLQNRYNIPRSDPAPLGQTSLTDIGLASTPDGGRSWVYRGVAEGLDVPASERADKLPPSGTQQYGGATWWRPAVTRANGTYHAFWVMWEPGRGMWGPDNSANPSCTQDCANANWNIVHYTSDTLKQWRYNQNVRRDSFAYDSDVFRLADGRYILFSTGQTRAVRGSPKPLQSRDLFHWEPCTDLELQVDIDEDGGLGRSVKAIRRGADADQHESSITMVEGVAMPGFCDQGRWDSLRGKLKGALRPDDVVVSTYPKCGTVRR